MRGEMPADQEICVSHRRCGEYAMLEANINPLAKLTSARAIVLRRISWIGPASGIWRWLEDAQEGIILP
jgi:hypothetical protein